MSIHIIPFVIWVVAGLMVLCMKKPVSKVEYGLVWGLLLMYIAMRVFGV